MLKQLLEPKDEVLTGKLQGVIDLERVADSKRRTLESRTSEAPSLLGQSRFKEFAPDESFPQWNPDLQRLPERRVAMLRGRMRTRPQGVSSRKLYHHGGLSLMEVLVPWIELEPK